ncbi:hypothetical protein [Proteus mirabilis]|uniref:hypothetical protein n=1 Tax=Proteus mirabilis TaxID=584 RepID=UPI00298C86E4|nr:hypothetical protein [Proteus mirabilis]
MLNLKLSMFVASLIAAAVVGGVGSSIVLNVFSPEPQPVACEPADALRQQRRSGTITQTGSNKGY